MVVRCSWRRGSGELSGAADKTMSVGSITEQIVPIVVAARSSQPDVSSFGMVRA